MEKEYKVVKITEMSKISETEGVVRYYRHTIKTKGGTTLTIDIDEKDFTAEKAAPILLKKATEADKILGL